MKAKCCPISPTLGSGVLQDYEFGRKGDGRRLELLETGRRNAGWGGGTDGVGGG